MSSSPILAIDVMGGDRSPDILVRGLEIAAAEGDGRFAVFGDAAQIEALIPRQSALSSRVDIHHAPDVVAIDAKPSAAIRRGRQTSMGRALDAVREGQAAGVVSAGNTGALMAMALFRLKRAPGVDRPAIAALWPSLTPAEYAVVLDLGADVRADAAALTQYAAMGTEYARAVLGVETPRVALLNVGAEPEKGPVLLRDAAAMIEAAAPMCGAAFVGYIEGDSIPMGGADVVVCDGFTGNVALKAAEGSARLIGAYLSDALRGSFRGRLGALVAAPALKAFKRRIDPRRVNGGVMLGLRDLVVKSHGSADAEAFAAAVRLALDMVRRDFAAKIAQSVEKTAQSVKTTEHFLATAASSALDGPAKRPAKRDEP